MFPVPKKFNTLSKILNSVTKLGSGFLDDFLKPPKQERLGGRPHFIKQISETNDPKDVLLEILERQWIKCQKIIAIISYLYYEKIIAKSIYVHFTLILQMWKVLDSQ